MEFVLVGQPNSGKSTIFNKVVGYKSETANFPGMTVGYTRGSTYLNGDSVAVVDIPGTYSLHTSDDAELIAVKYLLAAGKDAVIVNIIDASVLSRSLELTLQLMDLGRPMVIALNMMDEAVRKGIRIDARALGELTGLPVVETVGKKGKGVAELFRKAMEAGRRKIVPRGIELTADADRVARTLREYLIRERPSLPWNPHFVAIKLLENDPLMGDYLRSYFRASDWRFVQKILKTFESSHRCSGALAMSSIRHNLSFKIFEQVSHVSHPEGRDWRIEADKLLMHPIFGYFFMVVVFYLTFSLVFSFGDLLEVQITRFFTGMTQQVSTFLGTDSIWFALADGLLMGIGGGVGIVIPYLLPFFVVFAILEDTGYLARIAYLIDNLMHLIGLHGTSVLPLVLGYGCTVPGIMATRILKSRRDKLITATLTAMVPCSARMIIIVGVAGGFSMGAAALIYVINILVLVLNGKVMSKLMPEISPGLLMEIPKYHVPAATDVLAKTWFRLKEFVVIAWPLLILGSIVLEIIDYFHLTPSVNSFLSPFTTGVLGLPAVVGVVFLFGILRKELALVLLIAALGTQELTVVLSPVQLFTFTVFSTFYIPCLATFAALSKELGYGNAFLISGITLLNAVWLSLAVRWLFPLFQ